ncbi:chromatin modification-related protein EAF1 B-like isoform X1 [Prosopis cineraria]|uniref:chromatin modification-related protein EAF1 B-like isoform X1 n=1 Tax=Prosopis cineraria TaxID=364024 RepID=UPI00240F9D7C|nr:chromatin modification-related protein EAF1 B-like isoform X1 [Prosopis cineraria]XP_054782884.1 chromatin modification-related protein EAF1 B-like isoform X1 [Prosopis cineraria]XP_054782885.1 chromatin modification-related protein EAF1 B-like isoform X1 [Prosopis cineraria]XP_054782887.1 chromatin modification-related protein EAF1 B-like isoform X1 [Prosopis cineraria]
MHGCNSGSALLVNAEVDSMGGVIDGGVGIGLKTSPRRAAIEKAQAELRQEYDVREERKRELEFLEKGGNPLDFKFGNAASASVQSTSLTDQHHEQFVTSEAKGSFALTASPHGDSVDSSARPGAPSVSEPNTADDILVLGIDNELPKGERRSVHQSRRNNVAPSEQSSKIDGSQNAKDSEDSAIFRPYARRNRSRTNHGPRGSSRDGKGLVSETGNLKDHNLPAVSKPKPPNINGEVVTKDIISVNPLVSKLDGVRADQTTSGNSIPEVKLDITVKINCKEDRCTLPSHDDTVQNPVVMASGEADAVEEREPLTSADLEPLPKAMKPENESCSGQQNEIAGIKADNKGIVNEEQNGDAALGGVIFNSGSSCAQTSVGRDVNNDSDMCNNAKNVNGNGSAVGKMPEFDKKLNLTGCEVKERIKTNASEGGATDNNGNDDGCGNHYGSGNMVKAEEDVCVNSSSMQNKSSDFSNIKGQNDSTVSKTDKEFNDVLVDHSNPVKGSSSGRHHQEPMDVSNRELPQAVLAEKVPTTAPDLQPCSNHHLLADRAREDSILEEARIIEAKRKRITELSSIRTLPTQNHRKCHWGFVLEEMAWMANDYAQERLWKITAAAQLCHQAVFTSRLRLEEKNKHRGIKVVAYNIAKAVMQFWHSAELLLEISDASMNYTGALSESEKVDVVEASRNKRRNSDVKTNRHLDEQHPWKNVAKNLQAYALRFLKYSKPYETSSQAEAPTTPDRISDSGTLGMPWEEHLTEESLFYMVPSTAMEAYRKSVESHFLHVEKTGSSMQEEVEISLYDAAPEFGSEENAYDEDDGETSTYYLPGVYEGRKPKSAHKKHRNMMKSYPPRSCDFGADFPYGNYTSGSQPSMLIGKRPASLNVGPITKRMRTASRQRVVSPFTAGITGTVQPQVKTDASSGDTNSFQDDQSTLHCGSQIQKSVEVESIGEFERQLLYDCAEMPVKTKKKKKAKNLLLFLQGSTCDQGWQVDSVLNEQRDHSKKRLDSHHFDPNGSSGLYAQHIVKKPKTMKLTLDNTFDNIPTMNGSIPSPATSQMSNMSNQSKLIKIRDRGRKAKSLKIPAGQPGSGSPWSLFEDQALVVLVHDMGPNWELVSDAINSTLQFKCIFRKPKECKDRHKFLMDRSAGDGADSAEDSGSSQSYPSTLPGIPKGSARQLFQRLQGPMEEDTLKSHFENIMKIGQKQYYRRNQNDIQDLKQIVPVHNSHVIALTQVCPNNLNGVLLTPLDLCDTNAPTPDALSLGYQGSTAGGLALSNQGSLPSMHPTSGANSSLPGSSGLALGNNLTSPSGPVPASVRDIRYGVPRTSPLSVDEQQRMQQYNQMISGRNMQQASMSVPGSLSGSDRGVRMLHGGNGMGMMCGMNRSMSMSRPGLQGMAPSSMLNSGNLHSSSMVGMPSPVNMHSGVGTGQGNSMLRPREALHVIRPGHNPEHQRQMMVPELPVQVSQGASQGISAFNGLSSAFNNQTSPPPVQPYPGHAQQPHQIPQQQSHLSSSHPHLQGTNHATNPQQQALALRLAKERRLQHQQRYLQQQQFASSNTLMPHVQAQSQLPVSSASQNSSQIQSQNSSQQGVPVSPVTSQHQQQKHHLPQHGFSRNPGASGLTNQAVKQRQRQPQQQQYQQPGRQHPNPRQHAESQQQAKLVKGIGRGNMLAHQNISLDASHLNGLSIPPGSQNPEKGDPVMHVMQGQNSYPESGLSSNQQSKPLPSVHSTNHSQLQQKLHPAATATSSKHAQSMVSADSSAQESSGHILSSPQPAVITSNHHQMQLQSHPQSKQINQTQSNVQRMIQQSRAVHSELPSKSQSDPTQVDQQPTNSTSEVSMSSVMTQGCIDSANVVSAIPTASSQWKTSEPPSDSNMPNSAMQAGSLGNAAAGNSAVKEPLPQISQGIGSRQLSVNLPSHSQNSGAHWPQQPLPLQQSSSQPVLSQQPYKPQEQQLQKQQDQEKNSPKQVALQHQSQQQVQPGQSSLFIRPPNSRVE